MKARHEENKVRCAAVCSAAAAAAPPRRRYTRSSHGQKRLPAAQACPRLTYTPHSVLWAGHDGAAGHYLLHTDCACSSRATRPAHPARLQPVRRHALPAPASPAAGMPALHRNEGPSDAATWPQRTIRGVYTCMPRRLPTCAHAQSLGRGLLEEWMRGFLARSRLRHGRSLKSRRVTGSRLDWERLARRAYAPRIQPTEGDSTA